VLLQAACLLLGCLGCLDTLDSVHKGEAVDGCEAHEAELQASRCPALPSLPCPASLVSPVLSCCGVRFEGRGRSSAVVSICTFVLVKQVNLGFTSLLLDLAMLATRILIHSRYVVPAHIVEEAEEGESERDLRRHPHLEQREEL